MSVIAPWPCAVLSALFGPRGAEPEPVCPAQWSGKRGPGSGDRTGWNLGAAWRLSRERGSGSFAMQGGSLDSIIIEICVYIQANICHESFIIVLMTHDRP